jgi:glutamate-1-semialdehyde 2,1-aminomutase
MTELLKLSHLDMLEQGQYLARRGFISLSLPMTAKEHDAFVAAVDEFLAVRGPVVSAAVD